MREVPKPLDVKDLLEELRAALQLFETAFGQGPVDVTKALNLWHITRELRLQCTHFDELLTRYERILCGLLWAHHPKEYFQQVYPVIRDVSVSAALERTQGETVSSRPRKTMIEVAEEVFASRGNVPLSVRELVPELERRGIRFRAKDPEKSLAQAMRASGKFLSASRGLYHLKPQRKASRE